eukprot:569466-Rhodomonas_salina.3
MIAFGFSAFHLAEPLLSSEAGPSLPCSRSESVGVTSWYGFGYGSTASGSGPASTISILVELGQRSMGDSS